MKLDIVLTKSKAKWRRVLNLEAFFVSKAWVHPLSVVTIDCCRFGNVVIANISAYTTLFSIFTFPVSLNKYIILDVKHFTKLTFVLKPGMSDRFSCAFKIKSFIKHFFIFLLFGIFLLFILNFLFETLRDMLKSKILFFF